MFPEVTCLGMVNIPHPWEGCPLHYPLYLQKYYLLWKTFSYISSHRDDRQLRWISLLVDLYPHLNIHGYEMPHCLNTVLLSPQTAGALSEWPSWDFGRHPFQSAFRYIPIPIPVRVWSISRYWTVAQKCHIQTMWHNAGNSFFFFSCLEWLWVF